MQAKIVIAPNGQMRILVGEGEFEQGKARIEALLASLKAEGMDIALTSEIEQHTHGPATVDHRVSH